MKAKEVEWEVLPPADKERRAALEPLFKWLALIMDDFLRVPARSLSPQPNRDDSEGGRMGSIAAGGQGTPRRARAVVQMARPHHGRFSSRARHKFSRRP